MGQIILITGPVKSGKTHFAESLAQTAELERIAYMATQANAFIDGEMAERIQKHQAARPANWVTIEAFKDLGRMIKGSDWNYQGAIVDCLSLWATNLFFDHLTDYYRLRHVNEDLPADFDPDAFIETFTAEDRQYFYTYLMDQAETFMTAMQESSTTFWLVTNEVGWTLIQATKLGRLFTDYLGQLNTYFAQAADEVYLVTVGIPRRLKP